MTHQMMNQCLKTASGGQGGKATVAKIPWTPGCGRALPLVPRDKLHPHSPNLKNKNLFGNLFKRLAPGRAAGGIAVVLVLLVMASTLYADEAAQAPLTPMSSQQQGVAPTPMTDIHDIASPFFTGISSGAKKAMIAGGIAAVVILLALVALWLWFRRKQGPKKAVELFQPPDVLANMALDRIEPLMSRDGKAFYFELSEATKHYLKGRFGLNAPEMTAEELLPKLPGLAVTQDQKNIVSTLFNHAEPVKFAGVTPDHNAMAEDFSAIRCFVMETAQQAEQSEGTLKPDVPG